MNKVLLRLKSIKSNNVYEVYFDTRLSFNENIGLLNNLIKEPIKNAYIYDPVKRIFLDTKVPLSSFEIGYFMILYLFD